MSKRSIVIATYPMFGDVNPDEWIKSKLDQAQKSGLIGAHEVLAINPGSYGIQNIDFSFEASFEVEENTLLSRRGNDVRMMVAGKALADKIVGDTDTRVLSITNI